LADVAEPENPDCQVSHVFLFDELLLLRLKIASPNFRALVVRVHVHVSQMRQDVHDAKLRYCFSENPAQTRTNVFPVSRSTNQFIHARERELRPSQGAFCTSISDFRETPRVRDDHLETHQRRRGYRDRRVLKEQRFVCRHKRLQRIQNTGNLA
tara:strand:- start:399 stop:860 length:462 start_codon:yes stop_codon:yes gene_type:complete